ncbi:MAG: glycosyltransferase family 4 protein [Solirubrobacteraceae bacterium]|nr:glycosyltransferase family 4 protein [Solirubrobacteraceae bacterium]
MTHSVLALHHGYRVPGGEERAAEQLADLAEAELGERVAWLRRDSTALTASDAARGLLAGGLGGRQVTDAIERTGANLVHAHNLFPTFGPTALRAARKAGAAVVVHLHNTRLVCAVATNVRNGADCTQCHGNWAIPGIVHRCRGSLPESVAYGVSLPRWRREVVGLADAVIVPSIAARGRMLQLGLGLTADALHVVGGVAPEIAEASPASGGRFALLVGRLAPEKDVETAIAACGLAGIPLVIAGDGPEMARLQDHSGTERRRMPRHADSRRLWVRTEPYPGKTSDPAASADAITTTGATGEPTASAPAPLRRGSLPTAVEILGEELLLELPNPPVVRGSTVFVGRVDASVLAKLRAHARVALTPSLAHETFGLAALESMAAALPTIGSNVGGLPELLGADAVVPPSNVPAMAAAIRRLEGDDEAGLAAAARAEELASPKVVADRLRRAYDIARERPAINRHYR